MKVASALWSCAWLPGMFPVEPGDLQTLGADLLVLHGGEDIATSLYHKGVGKSSSNYTASRRDVQETALVWEANDLGIPIVGICRGAQLLCALAGGELWQHVSNHGQTHDLIYKGEKFTTNSCHHQMMIPTEDDQILAWSPNRSPKKYRGGSFLPEDTVGIEPEIVYFPKLKALGVQGHPEWLPDDHALNRIVRELMEEKLNVSFATSGV